jgi:ABC-type glycerol-3-phosphate transport system substrate-binding protein
MRYSSTLSLLLCLALLAACAAPVAQPPTPPGSNGPTRVGFAALPFEKAAYQPVIDAFNVANPDIQVEFVALEPQFNGDEQEQAAEVAAAADSFVSLLAGPEALETNLVADLRPLIDADATFNLADYESGAFPSSGPITLLPTNLSVNTLSYNSDLWDASGLAAPAANWSWRDLLAAAEQLTRREGEEVAVAGLDDGQDGRLVLAGLLAEAGIATTPAADGTAQIDTPAVAAIIEQVADLLQRGVLYRQAQADGPLAMGDFAAHIREGRVAMWLGGSSLLNGPGATPPAFALGDTALPSLPRGEVLNRRGYAMSAGSPNPAATWRWLSYLSQQEISFGGAMMIFGMGYDVPARRSLAERSGFWQNLPPQRAEAIRTTLAAVERLPLTNDLVRGNLSAALSAAIAGEPVSPALSAAQANLDRQLAERAAAAPSETSQPPVVQLPTRPTVPAGAQAITFAAFSSDMGSLQALADSFNAQNNGVYVTIEPPSITDGNFSLATVAAQYPCFAWPQTPAAEDRSALRDLQPLLDSDAAFDQGDYPPALLAPLRSEGALYGLPYAVQLRALHYNRDLFSTANLLPPNAEWTLADLLEAARLLTDRTGPEQRYGYAVDGSHVNDLLAFLGWQNAIPVVDGQPRFSDPQVVQAIGAYLQLLRDYSPHERLEGYSSEGFFAALASSLSQQGRLGMWFSSDFGGLTVVISNDTAMQSPPDLALAPPPRGNAPLSSADFTASSLLISAQTADAQPCWQWLKFLSQQSSGLGDRFPARRSVATSEAFLQQAQPGAAELYAAYADALAQTNPANDPYRGVDLFWLMRAVDRALAGADLERELADAQLLTEQYLACVVGGETAANCAKSVDSSYKGLGIRD